MNGPQRLSTDHRVIAGLSFDSASAAQQLLRYIETLTADPANIRLSAPKSSPRSSAFLRFFSPKARSSDDQKAKKKSPPAKKVALRKSEISQPCFFQHVTSVEPIDSRRFTSLYACSST